MSDFDPTSSSSSPSALLLPTSQHCSSPCSYYVASVYSRRSNPCPKAMKPAFSTNPPKWVLCRNHACPPAAPKACLSQLIKQERVINKVRDKAIAKSPDQLRRRRSYAGQMITPERIRTDDSTVNNSVLRLLSHDALFYPLCQNSADMPLKITDRPIDAVKWVLCRNHACPPAAHKALSSIHFGAEESPLKFSDEAKAKGPDQLHVLFGVSMLKRTPIIKVEATRIEPVPSRPDGERSTDCAIMPYLSLFYKIAFISEATTETLNAFKNLEKTLARSHFASQDSVFKILTL